MPRLFTRSTAATYLGMSDDSFDALVRPQIPCVQIGRSSRGYRWDRLDLDAWVDMQRKIPPAGAIGQEMTEWQNTKDSPSAERSGTSRPPSASGKRLSDFESRLDAARYQMRGAS